MNKKKIIMLCVLVVIILCLIFVLYSVNKEKPVSDNTTDEVNSININNIIKDQTIGALQFTNVSFVVIDGETNFYALVTNNATVDYPIESLFVNFIGDNLDYQVLGLSETAIKSGESMEIRIMVDRDLSATKSVKYVIKNEK